MTQGTIIGILAIAFGGFLTVHCPRAAFLELRSGVAKGRVNTFHRERDPFAFWLTIGATALAGVLGALFFFFGLAILGMSSGLIR